MIECDCCQLWYHSSCQSLSKTEATLVSEGVEKGIRWFCYTCSPDLIVKTTKRAETTDDKLDAIQKSIRELSDKVENNVKTLPDGSYSDVLKTNTDAIVKTVEQNTDQVKRQQLLLQRTIDQADTESRKLNAILYGLAESNKERVIDLVNEFMKDVSCMHQSQLVHIG